MRPRNEQCPSRQPGLWHTVDGDTVCVHCGALTYDAQPRTFSIRLVARIPSCAICGNPRQDKRSSYCDDCLFMRRVQFQRHRFMVGEMDEFAELPPFDPAPVTPLGMGSYDDWLADSIEKLVDG